MEAIKPDTVPIITFGQNAPGWGDEVIVGAVVELTRLTVSTPSGLSVDVHANAMAVLANLASRDVTNNHSVSDCVFGGDPTVKGGFE